MTRQYRHSLAVPNDGQEIDPRLFSIYDFVPKDHPKYSQEVLLKCLTYYFVTGNLTTTCKNTNIPVSTIASWRDKAPWWPAAIAYLRRQKNDELDAKLTNIMDKSADAMLERLENGDEVVLKDGSKTRKMVPLRDLAVAGIAVTYDKRALGRGEATQRVENVSQEQRVKKLEDQFRRIANERVVDGVLISKE